MPEPITNEEVAGAVTTAIGKHLSPSIVSVNGDTITLNAPATGQRFVLVVEEVKS